MATTPPTPPVDWRRTWPCNDHGASSGPAPEIDVPENKRRRGQGVRSGEGGRGSGLGPNILWQHMVCGENGRVLRTEVIKPLAEPTIGGLRAAYY